MRRAHAAASIDAPIERVWAVLTDTARYGDWNPFIPKVTLLDGDLAPGSRIRLWVRLFPAFLVPSDQRIVDVQPPDGGAARWAYTFESIVVTAGAVRGGRAQTLRQSPGGPVIYETEEPFTGWLSSLIPMSTVQAGFVAQAAALKAAAESGAGV